jgi:hypothetical protein
VLPSTLPPYTWSLDKDNSVLTSPLPLFCLPALTPWHPTVHPPYLLAFQVPVPASSWYIISSAAGTGFFCCQLEAQLLKNKTWLILSIICFHQDLDLHSGIALVIPLGSSFRTENPVFLWLSDHIFTHLFQMQFPSLKSL